MLVRLSDASRTTTNNNTEQAGGWGLMLNIDVM
jgi:hypothetical protein